MAKRVANVAAACFPVPVPRPQILEAEIDSLDEIERRHGASVAKRVAAAVKAKLSNKIKNLLAPNTPGQQEQEYGG